MIVKTYVLINALSDVVQRLVAMKLQVVRDDSLVLRSLLEAAISRFESLIVWLPMTETLDRLERQILALRLEAEAIEVTKIIGLSDDDGEAYKMLVTIRTIAAGLTDSLTY